MNEKKKEQSKEDEYFELGISQGLDDASVYLMNIAKEKFSLFKDNAEEIRSYAVELKRRSEKIHSEAIAVKSSNPEPLIRTTSERYKFP